MEKHVDITGALKFGWAKFKEHWLFLLVAGVLVYGVNGVLGAWVDKAFGGIEPTQSLLHLVLYAIYIWLYFNAIKALVAIVDSRTPEISDLFVYDKSVWSYVLAAILYGLVVGFGMILLIVPGIYFAVRFGLYLYAIADHKMGPIEALKESSRLTYGVRWELFLFDLTCIFVVLAGLMAFVVGIFVAIPVVSLATVYIYRELANQTKEPVQVTVDPTLTPTAAPVPHAAPAQPETAPEKASESTAPKVDLA